MSMGYMEAIYEGCDSNMIQLFNKLRNLLCTNVQFFNKYILEVNTSLFNGLFCIFRIFRTFGLANSHKIIAYIQEIF